MTYEVLRDLVARLSTMRYFPSGPAAQLALIETMTDLTDDEEKVRWLVKRMRQVYQEWPGEHELRACFCSRWRPKDGIEAASTIFPEGLPPDPMAPKKQIAAAEVKALPPGQSVSANKSFDTKLRLAVEKLEAKSGEFNGPATPEEIAAAPDWLRQLEGYPPKEPEEAAPKNRTQIH
ncbi:MAG: hypothetical protein ABSF62_02480 [Bryobacteraceae bacterium]|jgi:hypothetical protein